MTPAQQPEPQGAKMDKTCPYLRIAKKRLVGNRNRTTIGYCGYNDLTCVWVQENLGCPRSRPAPAPSEAYIETLVGNAFKAGEEKGARAATLAERERVLLEVFGTMEKNQGGGIHTGWILADPLFHKVESLRSEQK